MTAATAPLTVSAESLGAFLARSGNTSQKQLDSNQPKAFEAVLEEAAVAVNGQYAGALTGASGTRALVEQLQTLPEGGKLLPLLEQVLDGAVAQGVEPRQVLQELATRLQTVEATTDLQPPEAMFAAVLQVIEANPRYLAVADAEIKSVNRELTRMFQQLGMQDPGRSADPASAERLTQDVKPPAIDRFIAQLQQQTAANGPPQNAATAVLAAFKQLAADARASAPGPNGRSDSFAAVAPVQLLAAATPGTAGAVPGVIVEPAVGQANWDRALSERVQWLASQGMQRAQIRLNPAHLGPMEVRIQVQNDQATVHFTSAHAVVRDALEAALPRLRDMLGASGVELLNVDVSSGESFAEQRRAAEQEPGSGWNGSGVIANGETVLETPLAPLLETGLLDLFA